MPNSTDKIILEGRIVTRPRANSRRSSYRAEIRKIQNFIENELVWESGNQDPALLGREMDDEGLYLAKYYEQSSQPRIEHIYRRVWDDEERTPPVTGFMQRMAVRAGLVWGIDG